MGEKRWTIHYTGTDGGENATAEFFKTEREAQERAEEIEGKGYPGVTVLKSKW